jgi:hypothetical protein
MNEQANITIGELEANYQLYCKALKMLIAEKRTLNKIQRTVCWGRLETLHHCLPRQYKSPQYLYAQLTRDQAAAHAVATTAPPVE